MKPFCICPVEYCTLQKIGGLFQTRGGMLQYHNCQHLACRYNYLNDVATNYNVPYTLNDVTTGGDPYNNTVSGSDTEVELRMLLLEVVELSTTITCI